MERIAQFFDAEEAQIAAGYLRSNGIEVTLGDEQALSVMPEMRVGLGGYRLLCPREQAFMARALLAEVEGGKTRAAPLPRCAKCSSTRLAPVRDLRLPAIFGGLTGLIFGLIAPFAPRSGDLRCGACGHRQPDKHEDEGPDEPH